MAFKRSKTISLGQKTHSWDPGEVNTDYSNSPDEGSQDVLRRMVPHYGTGTGSSLSNKYPLYRKENPTLKTNLRDSGRYLVPSEGSRPGEVMASTKLRIKVAAVQKVSPDAGQEDLEAQEQLIREIPDGYPFDQTQRPELEQVMQSIIKAHKLISRAYEQFSLIPAPKISPDAKLGGKGFVLGFRDIKTMLTNAAQDLSDIEDCLADELANPAWAVSEDASKLDALHQKVTKLEQLFGAQGEDPNQDPNQEMVDPNQEMVDPNQEVVDPNQEMVVQQPAPKKAAPKAKKSSKAKSKKVKTASSENRRAEVHDAAFMKFGPKAKGTPGTIQIPDHDNFDYGEIEFGDGGDEMDSYLGASDDSDYYKIANSQVMNFFYSDSTPKTGSALVHKSSKDLWEVVSKDGDELIIKRLFDYDGNPLEC